MVRQQGLVPIGEVIADLPGPVQAIREATPQAQHHFTRCDQVDQLVGASEADPDLGFMARLLALYSLPRTNPGIALVAGSVWVAIRNLLVWGQLEQFSISIPF